MHIRLLCLNLAFLSLASAAAQAANSGRTADGCSYRIINGQYLTSCDPKPAAPAEQVVYVAAAPQVVTSYDAVPVRANAAAAAPSPQFMSAIETPSQGHIVNDIYETKRQRERDRALDATYAGLQLGSVNIKNADSSLGAGVTIGTYIDDNFGVELGYSYTKQDLSLGLDGRANTGTDPYGATLAGSSFALGQGADSVLTAHMITGEFQGYLTDTFKRLRPYLGLGLGWKSSTLKEKQNQNSYGYSLPQPENSELSQSMVGAIGTAGTKFRLGKGFHLGFAFRYFFPIARQESRLKQNASGYEAGSGLVKADEEITGAGQSQIMGGLQYAF